MTEKMHFDDLTKITCPLGMLDEDTRKRLRSWEHEWEGFDGTDWYEAVCPGWYNDVTYRAKPAPKRITRWVNVYQRSKFNGFFSSREIADLRVTGSRVSVLRIECDEDGGNPQVFVEDA